MPYYEIAELPDSVRRLPRHAQESFRAAFNTAWDSYDDDGSPEQETTAFKIAWAAVKKRYRKIGDSWFEK